MSVEALLRDKQIQKLVDPLLPREPWPSMRLKAKPGRNSGGLVGTAFDYAARFELQRRLPTALSQRWIAEEVLDLLAPIADADGALELILLLLRELQVPPRRGSGTADLRAILQSG